jgi:hypothetical protein
MKKSLISNAPHRTDAVRPTRLIVKREVIRELSDQVLRQVVGGSSTSEAWATGCTDTTQ